MFVSDVVNSGAVFALETTVRFAAQRQRLVASNIANLTTPGYLQQDVSVDGFRTALRQAIDERRSRTGGESGAVTLPTTAEISQDESGALTFRPTTPQRGIVFHDRNNRNIERLMQDQAENAMTFRVATDLLKSRYDLLRSAMSERV